MRRVVAIFRESRNKVTSSSNPGNMENCNGSVIYMDVKMIVRASAIFIARKISIMLVGIGMIIIARIVTTPAITSNPGIFFSCSIIGIFYFLIL